MNPSLPLVPTPSLEKSLDARDIRGIYAKGPAVINKTILNALVTCPCATADAKQEEMLRDCADALFTLVRNHTSDTFGPFSELGSPDEDTIGGLFGAQM